MKKKLQFFCMLCIVLISYGAHAQISYSQNFNDENTVEWTNPDDFFWLDDYESCEGYSIVGELFAFYDDSQSVSGSLGTSNGQPAVLAYSYKLVDYYDGSAYPNSYSWGSFTVSYSTSATGPWTVLETVSPANHVVSDQCAVRTVSFTPPAGNIYLRLFVNVNQDDYDVDALLYFDNVTVVQGVCNGTPAVAATVSTLTTACTNQNFTLSLNPTSLLPGLTYQWQSSTNGTTYTNVATGGTASTYTTTETQTTWYRAIVTCTNSGQSTNSTPVQVTSTGGICYCNVIFADDIEPITSVNFAGINNTSSNAVNGTPGHQNFTALAPGQVTSGQSYPIVLKGNTAGNFENFFTVYFDWNHDGDFADASESYQIGYITNSTGLDAIQLTGSIAVPATALAGTTYMRVFKSYDVYNTNPCSGDEGYGYGQVEDYLVNVTVPCTTPAPTAEALQIVCSGSTVGDLVAVGNLIEWYAAATGGTPLTEETALVNGTIYYAAQTPEGGCESTTRTAVTVQFSVIPPPTTATATQVVCGSGTVADLDVEADGTVIWYTAATAGTVVSSTTALVNVTTYYASQSINGCESATRTAVTVQFSIIPPPVSDSATQVFCDSGTVADLEVEADGDVTWYTAETGGTVVSENAALVSGSIYYASQSVGGCESATRTAVTALISIVEPPAGEATQTFSLEEGQEISIADIVITAEGSVTWFASEEDAINNTGAIDVNTFTIAIGETVTLYVVQAIGECVSEPFAITVSAVLGIDGFAAGALKVYPNPVKDMLTLSYTSEITSVTVYNLLGQQVLNNNVNQNETQIDLSGLSSGAYMVRVVADDKAAAIKIIKQ